MQLRRRRQGRRGSNGQGRGARQDGARHDLDSIRPRREGPGGHQGQVSGCSTPHPALSPPEEEGRGKEHFLPRKVPLRAPVRRPRLTWGEVRKGGEVPLRVTAWSGSPP